VDFLRVLAGEKTRLSDDPSKDPASFVAFGGSGNRLGGTAAPAHPPAGGGGGDKRRVVVDGVLQTATGFSDTAAEREKRAAAARARLAAASAARDA